MATSSSCGDPPSGYAISIRELSDDDVARIEQRVAELLAMNRNAALHAKLDAQIAEGRTSLSLSHDEIDEWRAQFSIAIPVSHLAYQGISIVESEAGA